jgi:hypothetical protein
MAVVNRSHTLKTDPHVFDATAAGAKTFEIRIDDRGFRVGEKMVLRRTRYSGHQMTTFGKPLEYTGEEITVKITHIQRGYGIADGWVGLSHSRPMLSAAKENNNAIK